MSYREIRFEEDIQRLESIPAEKGKILLYGSSFFAVWGTERAKRQWLENGALQVVNHGFGGARGDELLHYYPRLVKPYRPAAIVFRTGLNDVFQGKSAVETMTETEELFAMAKRDFPDIKLIPILIFDTASATEAQMDEMREYNRLLQGYAQNQKNVYTIDLNPFFYQEEKDIGTCKNFRDVFKPDMLHLTDEGYVQLSQYLIPIVRKILMG